MNFIILESNLFIAILINYLTCFINGLKVIKELICRFRTACRDIAEAVKNTKELQRKYK